MYREANCVADFLAKKAAQCNMNHVWISTPPDFITAELFADTQGRAYPVLLGPSFPIVMQSTKKKEVGIGAIHLPWGVNFNDESFV